MLFMVASKACCAAVTGFCGTTDGNRALTGRAAGRAFGVFRSANHDERQMLLTGS
jgi:hypothetical protein